MQTGRPRWHAAAGGQKACSHSPMLRSALTVSTMRARLLMFSRCFSGFTRLEVPTLST